MRPASYIFALQTQNMYHKNASDCAKSCGPAVSSAKSGPRLLAAFAMPCVCMLVHSLFPVQAQGLFSRFSYQPLGWTLNSSKSIPVNWLARLLFTRPPYLLFRRFPSFGVLFLFSPKNNGRYAYEYGVFSLRRMSSGSLSFRLHGRVVLYSSPITHHHLRSICCQWR